MLIEGGNDIIQEANEVVRVHVEDRKTGCEILRNNILKEAVDNEWSIEDINKAVAFGANSYRLSADEVLDLLVEVHRYIGNYSKDQIDLQMLIHRLDPIYEIYIDDDGDIGIRIIGA